MSYEDTKLALQASAILETHKVLVNNDGMLNSHDPWYALVHELVEWKKKP